MSVLLLILIAVLCLHGGGAAAAAPIDDFAAVDAWSVNNDGGSIAISRGVHTAPNGRSSMRLEFAVAAHHWGNAARRVSLPADTIRIEMDVYKEAADPTTQLYVWLFEADGDGYMASADFGGKRLSELEPGWHHLRVPIVSFTFDPRGNHVREPLTVNKLLIGLGQTSAKVEVANLNLVTVDNEGIVPDSRTTDLRVEDGPSGRVAIVRDNCEPKPGHSDPEVIASALRAKGWGVTFLKSGDLANPALLKPSRFDCLVLPYGPSCPYAAFEDIKLYLKAGGSLFSTGGYAFDLPCVTTQPGKIVPYNDAVVLADLTRENPTVAYLNTRYGKYGDTLGIEDDRVGVFDPSYHLLDVAALRGVAPGIPTMLFPGLKGYAACALLGKNNPVFPEKWRTYTPLIEAVDTNGRGRGPVGAVVHNYAGPYTGSSWAFFGATNTDLFAKSSPLLSSLPSIVERITAKTFLHSLSTDLAIYKPGETAKLSCKVANLGAKPAAGHVTFRVFDRAGKQVFASRPLKITLAAGKTCDAASDFRLANPKSDLYRVTAELAVSGKHVFSDETGFAVYDPKVTASGFKLNLRGNYFRDGDRPLLLSGTNVTGEIFVTETENPLIWDRDLARMNENGLNTARVVHFSPFLGEKPGVSAVRPIDLGVDRMTPRLERQLDALVQLCQKHKIVMLLDLHEWMGPLLSDEELAAQRRWAKLIAARYKGVPGLMIDIENEPNIDISKRGADWPPAIKSLFDDFRRANPDADDARAIDLFRNHLANRWIEANAAGLREGDPNRLVTVGFLQEYWALNKLMCVEKLDFANMHSYNPIETLRADIKLFDRRFEGKSMSLGEFGALSDHDKRNFGQDNPGQDVMRYLRTGHYVFGEGGSFIENWCWKDMDCCVFPWGINYTNAGPRKDILKAYRNQSLLFRQVRPVYRAPEIWLVVPVDAMLGSRSGAVVASLYKHVDALLDARVEFGVIDDRSLGKLPPEATLLIYAEPAQVSESVLDSLKPMGRARPRRWVTGDQAFEGVTNVTLGELPERVRDQAYGSTPQVFASSGHAFRIHEEGGGYSIVLVNPSSKPAAVWLIEPGNEKCMVTLGPDGVGLVRFNASGAIVAIEAQGIVRTDTTEIKMTGHFAVSSLDGKPLSQSRELVVLPFGEGEIDLTGLADAADLTVQTGDVFSGKWQALNDSRSLKIQASGADAFDIRIIAPKSELPALAKRIASELMLR